MEAYTILDAKVGKISSSYAILDTKVSSLPKFLSFTLTLTGIEDGYSFKIPPTPLKRS